MTKSVRFANTITALFSRGGGESVSYLLAAVLALGAAGSARADDVVDLGGVTVTISTAYGFSEYQGKIIQNGTINLTTNNQSGWTDGTYTIGSGAVVNCAKEFGLDVDNRVYTLNIKDGGAFTNTAAAAFMIPLRYATATLLLDNGTLASTQAYSDNYNRGPICIGYSWNNGDGANGKVIDVKAILTNNSLLQVDTGKLQIGGAKAANKNNKVSSVNIVFAVTNSTVNVKQGNIQIGANFNPGDWISNTPGSKTEVVFGQGADVTCNQIYVYKSQTASILFDGATLRWAGSGNSFVGQNSSVSGDIYTIGEGGLTIDIPSGKSLGIDGNSSALTGTGGITKIGDGSITWNNITSSGSQEHLFTGPLVVSNGTWTSSLSYAATSFAVDGASSVLALSGELTATVPDMSATDGGTLNLRTGSVTTNTVGTLTLGTDATLAITGGDSGVDSFSADMLDLTATAANPATLAFDNAAYIQSGSYNIITITGAGEFASGDEAKFALDASAPGGSTLSLSTDMKSLVLTVPEAASKWTGRQGDGKFSSVGNWSTGRVPGANSDVVISVASDTELECDIPFSVYSITFPSTSAKVTITGTGCITNATTIVNESASRHEIGVPVEFVASDAYAPIDVTGEVEFSGGVTGTVPANHSTFYGDYTLTATSWTLSSAITLAANATVTATGMTINLSAAGLLNAGAGAKLEVNQIHPQASGNLFGTYAGTLKTDTLFPEGNYWCKINSGFSGVLRMKTYKPYSGNSQDFSIEPAESAVIIIEDSGDFCTKKGYIRLRRDDSPNTVAWPLTLRSAGDWSMYIYDNGNNTTTMGINIESYSLDIDTSDYDDPSAAGHTVTIKDSSTKTDNILTGSGAVSGFGNGTLKFQNTAQFTGGLTASNSVTLAVNAGVYPGKGDVTITDTATFTLAQSGTGMVPVTGTLTMAGGTTLRIPTLASGVLPLSVNALAFTGESKVTLDINSGTLADGYYPLVKSATTLPEGAAEAFALVIDAAVTLPAGAEPSLVVRDNALILQVGDVSGLPAGVWVGGVDSNMSNPLNWKNLSVPAAGGTLDFSGNTQNKTVNADIPDITFATLTAGDNDITIKGSLNLETITNGVHVMVAANSTLTIEKDAVLTGSNNNIYMFRQNLGTIDIKGDLVINTTAGKHALIYYLDGSTGTIKAGGVLNNDTKNSFTLCGNHATPIKWEIGANGLRNSDGAKGFSHYASDNGEVTLKAAADFTVAAPIAALAKLKFDTTTVDGAAGRITLERCLENSGGVTIAGTGRVVANGTQGSSTGSNPVTVESAATLAVNDGKMISTGTITVNSGAALEVAQSGTVALGGDLTLNDGAQLAFNYTGRAEPVLDLEKKTVTFEEGETTNVTVRISADAGARAHGGKNVLTMGGKFAGATVTLAEGAPNWASGVAVEKGEIVLSVKPVGLAVFVR